MVAPFLDFGGSARVSSGGGDRVGADDDRIGDGHGSRRQAGRTPRRGGEQPRGRSRGKCRRCRGFRPLRRAHSCGSSSHRPASARRRPAWSAAPRPRAPRASAIRDGEGLRRCSSVKPSSIGFAGRCVRRLPGTFPTLRTGRQAACQRDPHRKSGRLPGTRRGPRRVVVQLPPDRRRPTRARREPRRGPPATSRSARDEMTPRPQPGIRLPPRAHQPARRQSQRQRETPYRSTRRRAAARGDTSHRLQGARALPGRRRLA